MNNKWQSVRFKCGYEKISEQGQGECVCLCVCFWVFEGDIFNACIAVWLWHVFANYRLLILKKKKKKFGRTWKKVKTECAELQILFELNLAFVNARGLCRRTWFLLYAKFFFRVAYGFRIISENESQNYYITFPKRSHIEGFECV